MDAIRLDLVAWKNVPFGGTSGNQDIVLMGLDWSAASFVMQVRASPGDTGTPYVALVNTAAGSEGISASYDSGYIHPITGAVVGATTIRPQINTTTLQAIPLNAADPTQPQVLAYDLHVTPVGLPEMQFLFGNFTLNPGVTTV
jgi:hypothetical protein